MDTLSLGGRRRERKTSLQITCSNTLTAPDDVQQIHAATPENDRKLRNVTTKLKRRNPEGHRDEGIDSTQQTLPSTVLKQQLGFSHMYPPAFGYFVKRNKG